MDGQTSDELESDFAIFFKVTYKPARKVEVGLYFCKEKLYSFVWYEFCENKNIWPSVTPFYV